jgi:hypothetical protein
MKKVIATIGLIASLIITDIGQQMKINSLEQRVDNLTTSVNEAVTTLAQSDSTLLNLQANTVQVLHDHIKNPPYPAEHSPSR